LDAIAKGPTSNANSTVITHVDISGDNVGDPLLGDPLMTSPAYDWVSMNTNTRLTKWYVDLLTNFDDKGIEDPRANSFIPWAQVGGTNKRWMRSQGVDIINSDIRMQQGPFATAYNNSDNVLTLIDGVVVVGPRSWYCNTKEASRWGDTVYVSLRTGSIAYENTTDDQYRAGDGTVMASGTFYTRPDAPTHFVTYHEMCFIKAEVLFRQGDKANAFAAYKEGIKAHIDLVNDKLATYGSTYDANPSKAVMPQEGIDNFLNNATGTVDNLTMGKIMSQKYIALSYNYQNWNDMRRHDYSSESYMNWGIPYEYFQDANAQRTIPAGKHYRRWKQCSHEITYNADKVNASHPAALQDDIYSYPVWWDIPE
jgi:hypothetical protein